MRVLTAYLFAYNALSALAWSYILILVLAHFAAALSAHPSPVSNTLPPLWRAATTLHARAQPAVAAVQTAALLDVAHAALGLVRSPPSTAAMQVASRLWVVWAVAAPSAAARTSPFYASMLLAWALAEIVRYAFYAASLLRTPPPSLVWLRYTLFYALYPLGAGSEWALMYAALPPADAWRRAAPRPADCARAAALLIWPPALYVMYTHMRRQRRKVLGAAGKGQRLGAAPAARAAQGGAKKRE